MAKLILYSREGCCLCEGLEERLRELVAPQELLVVDVDRDGALQARYGLTVPVLGLSKPDGVVALPPVPPRLRGAGLQAWLSRHGAG